MSVVVISLLFGAGVAGWVWSKVSRQTGNANPTQVTLVAGAAGIGAFIVFLLLLHYILNI